MTFRLDSRSLDILDLLVASERPLAAVDIANHLNISARMVRSSLAAAEPWVRAGHTILESTPGKGYSIRGSDTDRRNLAQLIRGYDQPLLWLSGSERLHVLLLALFFTEKPLQIKQLQQMLNLSRTSTLAVLDAAETWLADFPLALIRRPNYGCMISGPEPDWREAVIRLLQESAGDARLLALCRGMKTVVEVSYRKQMGLEELLLNTWRQLEIPVIRQLISPVEHAFEGSLSDQDYLRFFIYMAVMVYRNRIGKSNCTFPEVPSDAGTAQTLAEAGQLAAQVHRQFGIQLSPAELAWMALQMPQPARAQYPTDQSAGIVDSQNDPSVRGLVDQILHQAALSLHPSLRVDLELIQNLTTHVAALLGHMQQGRSSDHPLLKEVKDQYPYVYSVAARCSLFLTERLGRAMTQIEIGDVAICLVAAMERLRLLERRTRKVLVVCSAGAVTAWLLVSRLRAEFPNVEVVEVISALDLESRKHLEGVDFIVSTIPLRARNIPTLQVRPLLGLDDCKRLKALFDRSPAASPASKLPDGIHNAPVRSTDAGNDPARCDR